MNSCLTLGLALCFATSTNATEHGIVRATDPIHETLKKNVGAFRGVEAMYGQFCRITVKDDGGYIYAALEVQIDPGEHPQEHYEQDMFHVPFDDPRDWSFDAQAHQISYTAKDDARVDFQLDEKSEKIQSVGLVQADGEQMFRFWCTDLVPAP